MSLSLRTGRCPAVPSSRPPPPPARSRPTSPSTVRTPDARRPPAARAPARAPANTRRSVRSSASSGAIVITPRDPQPVRPATARPPPRTRPVRTRPSFPRPPRSPAPARRRGAATMPNSLTASASDALSSECTSTKWSSCLTLFRCRWPIRCQRTGHVHRRHLARALPAPCSRPRPAVPPPRGRDGFGAVRLGHRDRPDRCPCPPRATAAATRSRTSASRAPRS